MAAGLPTSVVAAGPPATRSGRSELDRRMAVLAKKQAALQLAIRQGRENSVDRAIQILEGALGDVVVIIEAQATEEDGPRREERRRDGFDGHPESDEAQRVVLREIQAQVTGAETWLERVRNDLYTATVAVQWTRAVDTRQGRVDMEPVPVRVIPATQSPSQASSTRSTVQPSLEWLANTIANLGVSRGSPPTAGAAEDALALLARRQALTSQSLQQVAEELTCWTDAEMKHRSKTGGCSTAR